MPRFGSVGESVGPPDHQLNGGVWVAQRRQRQRWKTKGREGDVTEVDRREEE